MDSSLIRHQATTTNTNKVKSATDRLKRAPPLVWQLIVGVLALMLVLGLQDLRLRLDKHIHVVAGYCLVDPLVAMSVYIENQQGGGMGTDIQGLVPLKGGETANMMSLGRVQEWIVTVVLVAPVGAVGEVIEQVAQQGHQGVGKGAVLVFGGRVVVSDIHYNIQLESWTVDGALAAVVEHPPPSYRRLGAECSSSDMMLMTLLHTARWHL